MNKILKKIVKNFFILFLLFFLLFFKDFLAESNEVKKNDKIYFFVFIGFSLLYLIIFISIKFFLKSKYKKIFKYIKIQIEEQGKSYVTLDEIYDFTKISKKFIKNVIDENSKVWSGTIGIYFKSRIIKNSLSVEKTSFSEREEKIKSQKIREKIDKYVHVSYNKI